MLYRLFLKPRVFILVPLILILAAAVACGDDATPTPAATAVPPTATPTAVPTATPTPEAMVASGTINVGVKELGVFSTHPRLTGGPINQRFGCCLTEQLVHVDATRSFVPELARDWSLAADGLTWTFKLQEGVQFHQGYGEMNVDDLIWSLEQYAAEDSVSAFAPNLRRLFFNEEGGMTRVDDYTLEVNTGTIQIDMLINAARIQSGGVFSKKQVDDIGEEEANFKGAATGPWAFEEARSGEFWKFSAVEDHWRKSPEFAELIKWEIPEESTRLANFQAGVIDTMSISLDSLSTIENVAGVKFMEVVGGANLHLNIFGNWHVTAGTPDQAPGFDAELPWVSSNPDVNSPEWERARKVREALALAIDRELIVETILGGKGRSEAVFMWETQRHRLPADLQPGREFDPARAKQLLEEAGYEDGFEITILASIREVPGEVETCSAIAQMWREIGIDAKEQRIPWGTFYPTNRDRVYQGANCHGGGTQLDPVPSMAFGLLSTGAIFNWGFDHPTLDALLTQASGIADDTERFELAGQIARFVYENVLEIALYSVNVIWPLSNKLDPWLEHLEYVDSRELGGFEYAKHRQ
jgi:peptide/nickel transport system substrate-binding protein